MEGRAWSSVQNPVVGLLALLSLMSYGLAAACLYGPTVTSFVRPNCGQLCIVQLWPALYGPAVASLYGQTVASFVWPNRGQFCMGEPWLALYGPTVASFVWRNCGQLCTA